MGKQGDKPTPPVRVETLKDYTRSIFKPLNRGESVTAVWVPMAGRRIVTKFILSHPEVVAKEIGDINSFCLAYVEPLDLTEWSLNGYLHLIGKSLLSTCFKSNQDFKNWSENFVEDGGTYGTYTQTLEKIKDLIEFITSSKKKRVVLFLGEFDELEFADKLFYHNLKSLWSSYQPNLQYVFLMRQDVTQYELILKFSELNEAILQNVVYVPLLDEEDVQYIIDLNERRLGEKFSPQERRILIEICGNHPFFLKSGCRIFSSVANRTTLDREELVNLLHNHYELRLAARNIWETRYGNEKKVITEIVKSEVKSLPDDVRSLGELGLVKADDHTLRLFSPLLEDVIIRREQKPKALVGAKLEFDPETGTIVFGERPVEEKFTRQEYEVLAYLMEKPNILRSRDDLGGVLWGENVYEKYSDWAIDQLISKIRKKLKELGLNERTLMTIRGRGYKFSQG